MKVNRDQLKAIIKECLIEILADGLGSNLTEAVGRHKTPNPGFRPPVTMNRSALSNVEFSPRKQVIEAAVREVTGGKNSVMSSIFADTAETTLLNQAQAGHSKPDSVGGTGMVEMYGDQAAKVVAATDPVDLFGQDMAQKWSQAAFSSRKPVGAPAIDFDPYSATPDMKKA